MEFCEKSTLRNCIDAGLYLDMDRMWRLFRELIEGLAHIHEQVRVHLYQASAFTTSLGVQLCWN